MEERIGLADFYLRNPEVRQYGFRDDFSLVVSEYDIWDTWTIPPGTRATVDYGDIPDEYRPAGLPQDPAMGVPSPKSMKTTPLLQRRARSTATGETQEPDMALKANELKRWRLTPIPGRENEVDDERPPKRQRSSSSPTAGRDEGSSGINREALLETFRRLRSIPSGSMATDAATRAETARAGVSDLADRTGPDWTHDSSYKGSRQPPLAVRLKNAITFLADEDVDRDPQWKPRFAELCDYLSWLAHDDEAYQLGKASRSTRALFDEAVDMAKAHVLFEKHHYEPTYLDSPFVVRPTGLDGSGASNPIRSTRLDWTGVVHDWPAPSPAPPPRRNDLPTRLYPRQPIFVNPIANPDKKIHQRFIRHTKRYWEQNDESPTNLAHIEGEAFFKYVALGAAETIKFDEETGQTRLPDGRLVVPGSEIDWAHEQGARRAGLQNLLRDFENKEHRSLPNTRCQRVVLPTPASKVVAIRAKTAGPQWKPVALKRSELPPHPLETHLYTFFYRKFFRHLTKLREAALLETEQAYGKAEDWVTLPRNVAVGGPFVLRSIDPKTQANQDLLAKCLTTVKVLEAEVMRASRPLLDRMMELIELGMDGGSVHDVPEDVKLAADEWELNGPQWKEAPRRVNDEDIKWLRFLATESVNDGTWEGRFVPDEPKEKYKLFQIFARRVKKLLDDRNPESLFNRHEVVTVEQLLEATNAGYASSAVEKCNFHPYDACAWLNRMRLSGHVRYAPSPPPLSNPANPPTPASNTTKPTTASSSAPSSNTTRSTASPSPPLPPPTPAPPTPPPSSPGPPSSAPPTPPAPPPPPPPTPSATSSSPSPSASATPSTSSASRPAPPSPRPRPPTSSPRTTTTAPSPAPRPPSPACPPSPPSSAASMSLAPTTRCRRRRGATPRRRRCCRRRLRC